MSAAMMQKFEVEFFGFDPKAKREVRKVFSVRARDTYQATDLLDEQHRLRDRFVMRRFRFNQPALKLSGAAKRAVRNAGPEEE